MAGVCCVCEYRDAVVNKRCRTCNMYLRRTGRHRPEELIVAEGRRILEAEMERKAWGPGGAPPLSK